MKKKPSKRKKLIRENDKLFGQIIRSVGKCERCGKREGLQTAHVFSRNNKSVRWDVGNAFCLCNGCHIFWAHQQPIEFAEFTKAKIGEKEYQELRKRASQTKQWTIQELEKLLKKQKKRYKDLTSEF